MLFIPHSISFALINLNNADFNELLSLGLTYKQINSFLDHKQKCGNLFSIYELQVIPKFDQKTIEKILPFVYVEEFWPNDDSVFITDKRFVRKKYWKITMRYGRVAEISNGYLNGDYVGTPDDFFTKIDFKHPQGYNFSLAYKKKYAESFYPGRIGGYLFLQKKLFFDQFLLGDYQIGCGQSLVLNSAFFLYKNLTNIDQNKHNTKIKYNSSGSKYNFRGFAGLIKFLDNFELVLFYSYRFLNFNPKSKYCKISYYDHYKTLNDLNKRNKLREQTVGNVLSWKKDNTEIGCNFVYNVFDHEIKNKSKDHFQGNKNYIGSIFGETILFDRFNIFGECTYLKTLSFIFGGNVTLLKNFSSTILFRNYAPYLHSFYGKPFHENNEIKNEIGVCNINFFQIQNLQITLAYDYFYFPQPTYKIYTSQHGVEKIFKITYNFNKYDFLSVRLKDKSKENNLEKKISHLGSVQCIGKKSFGKISLTTQIILGINYLKRDRGWGILETLQYKLNKINMNIFLGMTLTEGVRVYLREPMMKFCGCKSKMYNTPMLLCGGIIGYKFQNNLNLEVLYNLFYAYGNDSVGSGLDRIEGKYKNFIQMQMIYNF